MTDYEKYPVGSHLVIGEADQWRVMERFGSYRMLKKVFKTKEAAMHRADQLERGTP